MNKTNLPDLFFYAEECYLTYLQTLNTAHLTEAMSYYLEYLERGGKRRHEGMEDKKNEL
jgi:hypothetical protein